MSIEVKCVIGANYGDEGKGLMTDYFCQQAKSLVILSNGGAQRGHTVKHKDGKSHVFHHFGSGTLSGADTYLPQYFVVNPMIFVQEYKELKKIYQKDFNVYVSSECLVTTPFDMLLNQVIEESRGDDRHGSCGLGIWETILRHNNNMSSQILSIKYLINLKYYLDDIRDSYVPKRLKEEKVKLSTEWEQLFNDSNLIYHYLEDFEFMIAHIKIINFDEFFSLIKTDYKQLVFENGQGLLLDQSLDKPGFRTTPSHTGMKNCYDIINQIMLRNINLINHIECCYVSRTYLTKHGQGEFKEENSSINQGFIDATNIPNEWQGHLRYGKLDFVAQGKRIIEDYSSCTFLSYKYVFSTCLTHLNELDEGWAADYLSFSPYTEDVYKMKRGEKRKVGKKWNH